MSRRVRVGRAVALALVLACGLAAQAAGQKDGKKGKKKEPPPDGVPVLQDQHDPVLVVDGRDRHGTRVLHDLAGGDAPTGHDHAVGAQRHDTALVDVLRRLDPELVRVGHGRTVATEPFDEPGSAASAWAWRASLTVSSPWTSTGSRSAAR